MSEAFEGASLRPAEHKTSRAQEGRHTEQDVAGRSNKEVKGNRGKEKQGQKQRGEGAGRSISAARTHSRFSK